MHIETAVHDSRLNFCFGTGIIQLTLACLFPCVASFPFASQDGKSALQVWGIPSDQRDQDVEVEDEDKEAFQAHVEAVFADTK